MSSDPPRANMVACGAVLSGRPTPLDLPEAREGVEQCLAILAEMKDMLGG